MNSVGFYGFAPESLAELFEVISRRFGFSTDVASIIELMYLVPLLFGGICVLKDANITHAILLKCLIQGHPTTIFGNICAEDDLRSRIFGTFVVKFLVCLPLLGFSNI